MSIAILSFDYKSMPIELLEKCFCNKDDITFYLSTLVPTIFFEEIVIISTCNRVEWVFTSTDDSKALDVLLKLISKKIGVSQSILKKHANIYLDEKMVLSHLFELTGGLKSMVLGENEILSQIKDSYLFCSEFGATKSTLNKVFQMVISLGKDVRTKTEISKGAHSISSIAIDTVKSLHPNFINEPILLIGSGVMIQRALAKLSSMGHQKMWISNRSMSKVEELANSFDNLDVIPYANINHELHKFNTIYVAIRSPSYLFNEQHFNQITSTKFVVDLGVPRNVDPGCKALPNIKLISIDQLDVLANQTLEKRQNEIPKVLSIINCAVDEFFRWQKFRMKSAESWVKKPAFG